MTKREKIQPNPGDARYVRRDEDGQFTDDQTYAAYKPGDKVADYGLAALVTGGAVAVAAKSGLWKVIVGALVAGWKFIVAGVVALFAALGRIFKRKTG